MFVEKFFNIRYNDIGQRLDNYLIKRLKGIKKNKIYSLIRKGGIKVNNISTFFFYRLNLGDNIYISPLFYNFNKVIFNKDTYLKNKEIIIKNILYEDKYILIINKPNGISVHGGSGVPIGIIELLRTIKNKNLELVHRLDKDTSGILLLSKRRKTLKYLHQQLREQYMYKEYIALVHGHWNISNEYINIPILKVKDISLVHNNIGKIANSYITVIKYFKNYTLIKINLLTGRTHQIRVHAAYLGHPIIFDNIYGDYKLDNIFMNTKDITIKPSILLHACYLKFYHPNLKKIFNIYANNNNFLKIICNIL